jgi:hypothetical protein
MVGNNSINWIDILGLVPGDQKFGLPDEFWEWWEREKKKDGRCPSDNLTGPEAKEKFNEWKELGKPVPEGGKRVPKPEPIDEGMEPDPEKKPPTPEEIQDLIDDMNPEKTGWDYFKEGAAAAATIAVIAGQAGPQAAAPEEIVTVPVAAVIGSLIALFSN